MTTDPSFEIPARPQRRFPHDSGVEYEGGTEFRLLPDRSFDDGSLPALVRELLAAGPYRYGDFHDLPMPLWLVRDEETADVFRVAVRDGTVRLHVLPTTESAGLRRFYDRLRDASGGDWTVERHVTGA
ncbi:hypothetical protein ACFQL1_04055 [Halomicroarcula sp. GCM10025709]|uniref:hypothetical protein n=1 Tax=Haloarcula TaxID=2237 RepID=UPI0024C226B4|nr:hypothetical protein [Halomicroarcula sp. YJ-61-S]